MQLQQIPLLPDKQAALEKYLADPAFDILIEVLASGRFDMQMAASQARELEADTVGAADAVKFDEVARHIARMIATLNALKDQKEPFKTTTATP